MNEGRTLVIWTPEGKTLYFENVQNIVNGDAELTFEYFGVSTQVIRRDI